jgi:hypothetical protein
MKNDTMMKKQLSTFWILTRVVSLTFRILITLPLQINEVL